MAVVETDITKRVKMHGEGNEFVSIEPGYSSSVCERV